MLPPLGVKFDDSDLGWKRVDAAAAVAEQRERQRADLAKLERSLAGEEDRLEKMERAARKPDAAAFRAQFSEFDAKDLPTKMADGTEVLKKRGQKLQKEWTAQVAAYEKLEKVARDKVAKAKGADKVTDADVAAQLAADLADTQAKVAHLRAEVDKARAALK